VGPVVPAGALERGELSTSKDPRAPIAFPVVPAAHVVTALPEGINTLRVVPSTPVALAVT